MKKNMLWNAAGNLTYQFCQWIITVLVAISATGFADAGLLSIAMSVSAIFQTVAMFGIRNFQVSDITGKHSDTCYVSFRLITCSVALVLCFVFSLCNQYRSGQLAAILLFMLFRLAENFSDVLHGIAQKNDRLDIAGKAFTLKGIGSLAVFTLGYLLTKNLLIGLGAMVLFSLLSTLCYDLPATRRLAPFRALETPAHQAALAKETWPLCLYLFLVAAMTSIPKLLLEKQCGEEILGAYSSIFAPALLISAAASYLYNPFAPSFAIHKQNGNKRAFFSLFAKLTLAIAIVSLLILGAGALLGKPVLLLLFGEKIRAYTAMLLPILLAISVFALTSFLCMLEIVLHDFLFLIIGCLAGVLSEIALTNLLIGVTGANGASYAIVIGAAVSAAVLLFRIPIMLRRRCQEQAPKTTGLV